MEEPASQAEAIERLTAEHPAAAERILRALKEGALYRWEDRYLILTEEGTFVDLGGEVLLDSAGEPLFPSQGLESVVLLEEHFPRVQRILEELELFAADPETRRRAALRLRQAGDIALLPLLEKAEQAEKNGEVRRTLQESIAVLKLSSDDPEEKVAACRLLARTRSESALSLLKGLQDDPDAKVRKAAGKAVSEIETYLGFRNGVGYVFNGMSLSSILLIMSLGLAVTFGLMGIINMAHGEMLMLGSYVAYVVQETFASRFGAFQGLYFIFALPLAFIVVGLVGLVLEWGVLRHLYGRPLETLIVTWGIGMILSQGIRLLFGDQTSVNAPAYFRGGWEMMPGLILPWSRLFIIVLSIACLTATYLLLFRTRFGLNVRACMQNRQMAASLGVSTRRVDALTFAFGTALAGIAGAALSLTGTVDPEVGKTYIVDCFMVVVLGGVGKLVGTVVASVGIGVSSKVLEPLIGGTAGAIYAKLAVLGLVIFFLQMRPTGLFPAKGRAAEAT